MSKRRSPAAVKVIACLLLLGSLACLLLPWMKLSFDTARGRMSPGQLLQEYAGMDPGYIKDALRQELIPQGEPAATKALDGLLDAVLDGRFRLHELGTLCRDLSSLCGWLQRPDLAGPLSTAEIAIWATVGLLGLLWLIALICQLSDSRWGILPYILLGAAITGLLLYLRAEGNRFLLEQSDALLGQYGLAGLVSLLGIDVQAIKMGIGAYLCPFLALIALLLMGIRKKAPKRRARPESASPYPARRAETAPAPRPVTRTTWTCPACGLVSGTEQNFCQRCGCEQPRVPAAVLCPFCGKRLPRDAAFCTDCGTPIPKAPGTGVPAPRPPLGGEN